MKEEELPMCPSYRIRLVYSQAVDTICSRCIKGTGIYLDESRKIKLVCGFYEDTYYPAWLKMRNEEKQSDLERAMRNLRGKRR